VLRIDVITIFPRLLEPFASESMMGIAQEREKVQIRAHDLRDWTTDKHNTVDAIPYGGGAGMVMKPEPLVAAIEEIAGPKGPDREGKVILLSPQGRRFDQGMAEELARESALTLVCGRYEGLDQRAIDVAVDCEVSIGDYVLCGGEVPAMAMIEAITRLLPGVLGNPESLDMESFQGSVLEGPQYTRPAVFRDLEVPAVLRSGNHAAVAQWRKEQALERTKKRRPDLLDEAEKNRKK
jgi:tRNA (guanine37-N1)-methyltransferase